ncbi:MAG: hypothetical protein ACNA7E_01205 [Wenzhouxiangellaceae bacterium]
MTVDKKLQTSSEQTVSDLETRLLESRRRMLAGFSLTAAASLPALAFGGLPAAVIQERAQRVMLDARNQGFPDSPVTAHTGERFRFFTDLVQGRVVLINFMSIGREAELPITERMAALVNALGDRVGRDIHVFSISYDEADTPEKLAEFAGRFGVPAGWKFLSATADDVVALGYRLYRTEGRFRNKMHSDLIHYGNAKVGLWGTMSSEISDLEFAVQRVSAVLPSDNPGKRPRRAGPRRIEAEGPLFHHRDRVVKA